jgi:hypothetical protein
MHRLLMSVLRTSGIAVSANFLLEMALSRSWDDLGKGLILQMTGKNPFRRARRLQQEKATDCEATAMSVHRMGSYHFSKWKSIAHAG